MSAIAPAAAATPKFELTSSRQFPEWMAEQRLSLAFTTYQAGKLFLIGLNPKGRLSVFERTFNRCMGLAMADGVPRYASAVSKTDVADGWREKRRDGGVAIDMRTNEVVVLPGVVRLMALGLVSDEIRRTVSLEHDLPAAAPQ